MSSLFGDFDIDMNDVAAAGGRPTFADGSYEFNISEARVQNGTQKYPDNVYFVISYNLDEHGTYQEWFTIAVDGEVTASALQSLGFLKTRFIGLGLPADSLNNVSSDDLEGLRGVITLTTKKNAKGEFQNISKLTLLEDDEEDEDDDDAEAEIAAAKKRVAAKQAARAKAAPAKKAPAKKAAPVVADDEDDDNPYDD